MAPKKYNPALAVFGEGRGKVAIYKHSARGIPNYRVAWFEGDERCWRGRRDLGEAKRLAQEIWKRNKKGTTITEVVRKDEAVLVKELKRSSGDKPVSVFLKDARAAREILPAGVSLLEAARFYRLKKGSAKSVFVPDAFQRYREYSKAHTSKRNAEDISSRVGRFAKEFESRIISDIEPQEINEFLESLDIADKTRKNFRGNIVSFFRWAKEEGFLPRDGKTAAEDARRVDVRTGDDPTIFTPEEMRRILSVVSAMDSRGRSRGFVEGILAYTCINAFAGLRPSETLRLKWEDVDFGQGHIWVAKSVARKTNMSRHVDLQPNLLEWLFPLRKADSVTIAPKTAHSVLSKEAKKAGIDPWPPDVLRHSFCSYLKAVKGNEAYACDQAGHDIRTFRKHYRRPFPRQTGLEWFGIFPNTISSVGDLVAIS